VSSILPQLLVIAGCNGSGKSTFSKSLVSDTVIPFDYDKCFIEIYRSKPDSELREKIAHHQAFQVLEDSVRIAIENNTDFCYETNFNSTPMYWPELFRKHSFQLDIFFFCLNSIEEAKKRVKIRFENGGHFVPDNEVEERFYLGYKHLNSYYKAFDNVHLFDSSGYDVAPAHVLSISNGLIHSLSRYPSFLENLLPDITKDVNAFLIKEK